MTFMLESMIESAITAMMMQTFELKGDTTGLIYFSYLVIFSCDLRMQVRSPLHSFFSFH